MGFPDEPNLRNGPVTSPPAAHPATRRPPARPTEKKRFPLVTLEFKNFDRKSKFHGSLLDNAGVVRGAFHTRNAL